MPTTLVRTRSDLIKLYQQRVLDSPVEDPHFFELFMKKLTINLTLDEETQAWTATVDEIACVVTQGKTVERVLIMLASALQLADTNLLSPPLKY